MCSPGDRVRFCGEGMPSGLACRRDCVYDADSLGRFQNVKVVWVEILDGRIEPEGNYFVCLYRLYH